MWQNNSSILLRLITHKGLLTPMEPIALATHNSLMLLTKLILQLQLLNSYCIHIQAYLNHFSQALKYENQRKGIIVQVRGIHLDQLSR